MLDYEETMNLSYWEGFLVVLEQRHPEYRQRNASKEQYQIVPPTWFADGIRIAAGINRKHNSIRVDTTLRSKPQELAKEWFRQLETQKRRIEHQIGSGLFWDERPKRPESHIILFGSARLDGARRPQYEWLADNVHRFHQVFRPLIEALPGNRI